MSGLYPAEIKDDLVYNNCRNKCVENVRVKDDNDIVVKAKINGCVGEVLFDSGAQISLIDERFLTKHKHYF